MSLLELPKGSGKLLLLNLYFFDYGLSQIMGRCVYIAPFQEVVDLQVAQWRQKFGKIQGGKNIVALTGETSADLRLLESGDVIFAMPIQTYSGT